MDWTWRSTTCVQLIYTTTTTNTGRQHRKTSCARGDTCPRPSSPVSAPAQEMHPYKRRTDAVSVYQIWSAYASRNNEIKWGSRELPPHGRICAPRVKTAKALCTKFEKRSFIRLRNIEGSQNFEIGSRHQGHAHYRGQFAICEQERTQSVSIWHFIHDEDMALFPSKN